MKGLDCLGIGSRYWDLKATKRAWRQGVALGLFADDTFGPNAEKYARAMLDTGMVPAVRAHLDWSNHKLPPLSKIRKLAPRWEAIARAYPSIRVYVSPACEYESGNRAAIVAMLDTARQLCPSCTIVQTPIKATPVIPGYMLELHGKRVARAGQIISYDGGNGLSKDSGEGLFDIDSAKWVSDNSRAEISFAWGPLCNLAEAHNTLPPPQRKTAPDWKYLVSLIRLFDAPGSPPTPSFSARPLWKPQLYKSHAEDSPGVDTRNNRPLVIIAGKAANLELVTFQGARVGRFKYYDHFPGDLERYYSGTGVGLYGWELADKAQQMSGSPFVWIKHQGKFYGPVHPTFRTPYFQA